MIQIYPPTPLKSHPKFQNARTTFENTLQKACKSTVIYGEKNGYKGCLSKNVFCTNKTIVFELLSNRSFTFLPLQPLILGFTCRWEFRRLLTQFPRYNRKTFSKQNVFAGTPFIVGRVILLYECGYIADLVILTNQSSAFRLHVSSRV